MQLLALLTSILLFVEFFDTTILNVCSVPIASAFSIPATHITQAIMSYIIGTCLFIPVISWLTKRIDKYKIIFVSIAMFALSSLICGIAYSLTIFSAARFIQGASISVASSALLISLISASRHTNLVKMMATINILALFGAGVGPLLGAVFSKYLSWRVAFLINLPICLLSIYLLLKYKRVEMLQVNEVEPLQDRAFDIFGYLLLAGFLLLTSFGFEAVSQHVDKLVILSIVLGVTLLLVYIFYSIKFSSFTLLPLQAFNDTNFSYGFLINIIVRFATAGFPLLMGIYLQQGAGFTILQAGLYLSIIALASIAAKISSKWIDIVGIRHSISIYTFATAIMLLMLKNVDVLIADKLLWIPFAGYGFFVSMLYTAMNSVCFISVQRAAIPDASTIIAIMQQFCVGFGVSLAVGGYQYFLSSNQKSISAFAATNEMLHSYHSTINLLILCMLFAGLFSVMANLGCHFSKLYRLHSKPLME